MSIDFLYIFGLLLPNPFDLCPTIFVQQPMWEKPFLGVLGVIGSYALFF
jgi:hypothetical protein